MSLTFRSLDIFQSLHIRTKVREKKQVIMKKGNLWYSFQVVIVFKLSMLM